MSIRIQLRRGTAAEWTAANPVLEEGEPGVELDTRRGKLGDGVTAWNTLPYADAVALAAAVAAQADIDGHEASTTAHTAAHVTVDHTAAGLSSGSADVQAALTEIQAEILSQEAGDSAAVAAEINARQAADGAEQARALAAEALLIPLTQKGAASGVATLDSGGLVPTAQIPPIAISNYLGNVASQAAMLALTGQRGDWATRSDLVATFILIAEDASQLANWKQLPVPTDNVLSVNGRTGVVTGLAEGSDLTSEAGARATADTTNLATATGRAVAFAMIFGS